MPKVVVIGESGQLAQSLRALPWPSGFELSFHGRKSLKEVFQPDLLRDLLRSDGAHLVLNAAAYTAVDRAESDPQAASALNARLPQALATACGSLDVPLVHISTDYVFDGLKLAPYVETDAPNPLSVYGATKLAGERAIELEGLHRRWAILRVSWLFSEIGDTFPAKLLRRARAGEQLRVVDDQIGCPTSARVAASAMQKIGFRLLDGDQAAQGLLHYCGDEALSWHGFASRIMAAAGELGLCSAPLHRIGSAELAAPARRPEYSVLSCRRIAARCGIEPASCQPEIERVTRLILAASPS